MSIFKVQVEVKSESGLHARPAGILVKAAAGFKSKIELEKNGVRKNAKSIMSLMSLGAVFGDHLNLIIEGEDAETAGPVLKNLFETKFEL
jgi:phosphotransferase system HPr (HPr) family protein